MLASSEGLIPPSRPIRMFPGASQSCVSLTGSARCACLSCLSVDLKLSFLTRASIGAKPATCSCPRCSFCQSRPRERSWRPATGLCCRTRTAGAALSTFKPVGRHYSPPRRSDSSARSPSTRLQEPEISDPPDGHRQRERVRQRLGRPDAGTRVCRVRRSLTGALQIDTFESGGDRRRRVAACSVMVAGEVRLRGHR